MIRIGLALITAMLAMPLIAEAELYRYDDENGSRHVANSLNDVPEQYREAAIADLKARSGEGGNMNIVGGLDKMPPAPPTEVPSESTAPVPDSRESSREVEVDNEDSDFDARQRSHREEERAARRQVRDDAEQSAEEEASRNQVQDDADPKKKSKPRADR